MRDDLVPVQPSLIGSPSAAEIGVSNVPSPAAFDVNPRFTIVLSFSWPVCRQMYSLKVWYTSPRV